MTRGRKGGGRMESADTNLLQVHLVLSEHGS
jgi:hypothetical protein